MLNVSESEKKKYLSAEIETLEFSNQDIVTASNQGASDGDSNGSDLDNSGWT